MKGLLSILLATASFAAQAQYKKIFFKPAVKDGAVKLEIVDAVATAAELKFRLKITNNTDEIIVFKPEESAVVINGEKKVPQEKWVIIRPHSDQGKTINVPGSYLELRSFDFVSGGMYRASVLKGDYAVEDFRIPPATNSVDLADYKIDLEKFDKETSGTTVKFRITYTGKSMGVLQPKEATLKMPDEKYYAVTGGDSKPDLLFPNQSTSVTLKWNQIAPGRAMDMQFVEMYVNLRKVLTTGNLEAVPAETINLEFDAGLTDAKK